MTNSTNVTNVKMTRFKYRVDLIKKYISQSKVGAKL